MKNKQYIKISSSSIESIAAEGAPCPEGATGLFRTVITLRDELGSTGFYGEIFFFEEDSAEERMNRLQQAVDKMMERLRRSDIFKSDKYEVLNRRTIRWERKKL